MGDFFLNFANEPDNRQCSIAKAMRYYDDMVVREINCEKYAIVLSRMDDWNIWGPYGSIDGCVYVALAGRIALDSHEWEAAREIPGDGGLACKAIYKLYRDGGIKALESLNGSYAVILHDKHTGKLHLINDRCGMYPCYSTQTNGNGYAIGSHPDIIAEATNQKNNRDLTSMTEFLITGKVSYPNSFYENIKALDYGSIHTFDLNTDGIIYESGRKYFDFKFNIDQGATEWDLAHELAAAFKNAVKRRTLPLFGRTGISLSGGLDSRALLCAADDREKIWTFCFFDEENREYEIAKEIAEKTAVRFIPLRRSFDHYGMNANMGVKISGGMGDLANNHYLGFRDTLKSLGIENIIAGFYCDYLFKSLVLNKTKNKLLRRERFTGFRYDNYVTFFWAGTTYAKNVKERQDLLFPDELKKDESDYGRLEIERRRLFPLYTEPDNMETLVPQRVMGWYLPIVDNDIINTYLKIPPNYKLNTSMYSKTVELICGNKISRITNANTGAKVNANQLSVIIQGIKRSIQYKKQIKKKSMATTESWPNWYYYVQHSEVIKHLWMDKKQFAETLFVESMGFNPYEKSIANHTKTEIDLELFRRMLTLKIWLDQTG